MHSGMRFLTSLHDTRCRQEPSALILLVSGHGRAGWLWACLPDEAGRQHVLGHQVLRRGLLHGLVAVSQGRCGGLGLVWGLLDQHGTSDPAQAPGQCGHSRDAGRTWGILSSPPCKRPVLS